MLAMLLKSTWYHEYERVDIEGDEMEYMRGYLKGDVNTYILRGPYFRGRYCLVTSEKSFFDKSAKLNEFASFLYNLAYNKSTLKHPLAGDIFLVGFDYQNDKWRDLMTYEYNVIKKIHKVFIDDYTAANAYYLNQD